MPKTRCGSPARSAEPEALQAEETKLWGEGFGREAGIYPGGVRSEDLERLWRAVLFRGGGDPAKPDRTGETVELQGATPDQLREAPVPGATSQLHLEEAVLGVDVALGEEQVSLAFGEDLGHPEAVPQDLDGAFEARKLHRAVERDRKSTRLNSSHTVISYA